MTMAKNGYIKKNFIIKLQNNIVSLISEQIRIKKKLFLLQRL